MVNNKNKKNKNKNKVNGLIVYGPAPKPVTRKRKSKAKKSMKMKGMDPMIVHQVCGLSDPFCDHALTAKYPDDSNARTLTFPQHGITTLSTNAGGGVWSIFLPQYTYGPLAAAATVSGSQASTWSDYPNATTSVIGSVSKYRIVSCGFKLRNICAPLTSAGIVSIRILSQEEDSTFNALDLQSYARSESIDIPLQDAHEVAVIIPHSSQMPQAFYPVSSDVAPVTSAQSRGFNPVTIYVSGAPASTAVLSIEYFINYELQFYASSGMGILATPAPPANSIVTSVANTITSAGKSIFTAGAKAAAAYVVSQAKRAIAARLGGPAGLAIYDSTAQMVD
jgi:hypothetical protein